MQIMLHGGKCCGIKSICGLPYFPEQPPKETHPFYDSGEDYLWMADGKAKTDKPPNDAHGTVNSPLNMYWEEAPRETGLKRLDRYLEFLANNRKNGIVEIVLTNNNVGNWRATLESRGFYEVTSCHNSNSGNRIHVFYKVMDKEVKKTKQVSLRNAEEV